MFIHFLMRAQQRKILVLSGILLSIAGIFCLSLIYFFVNPDQLRPVITSQVEKYTGCKLIIDDHLTFAFFPHFAVKVNHIQMITQQQPTMKIDIKNAFVQLKLIPLLHGKLKPGAVQIDQVTLSQQNTPLNLQLNKIRLKTSAFDQSTNSFFTDISFDWIESSLPLSGQVSLSGEMTIDLMHQTAAWNNFNATLADVSINGNINATNIFSDPNVSGHFTLSSSHIKKIFNQLGLFNLPENFLDIDHSTAEVEFVANNENVDIQGNVALINAKIADIPFDEVSFRLHFKNNMLTIESLKTNLYGGTLDGEATINFGSSLPMMTAHVKTFNVQIEPLFKLIQSANTGIQPNTKASGTGDIELNISTSGDDEKSLLNNLSGTSYVSLTNGTFAGKDWEDVIFKFFGTQNVAQETIPQSFRVFRFKQLLASLTITNGVVFCNDLLLKSADVIVKGKGNINLPNNTIDYELQTELQNPVEYEAIYNNAPKINPTTIYFRGLFL